MSDERCLSRRDFLRLDAAECLHDDPQSGLVIHARCIGELITHRLEPEFQRHRVPDADDFRRLALVAGTDVQPQIFQLDHLLAFLLVEQVDGLAR